MAFDPDAALALNITDSSAPPQDSAPAFDPDAALAVTIVDPNLPRFANGATADAPLNQTPDIITPEVRRALSVGNEKGIQTKLQELGFNEIQKYGDSWAVKDPADASWKVVDPNIQSADAWDFAKNAVKATTAATAYLAAPLASLANAGINAVTGSNRETNAVRLATQASDALGLGATGRETISEFVENEGTAANIAANVALGAATGGASIPAQIASAGALAAALKAGETSLGRLAGTYEATPEEQLADVGIEGLMNMGGTAIGLGVKPTLNWFKNTAAVKKIGDMLGNVGDASFDAIKNVYSQTAQIAPESFDALRKAPGTVQGVISRRGQLASYGDFVDDLTLKDISTVQKASQEANLGIKAMYQEMRSKVNKLVPADFNANVKDITDDVMADFAHMGIIKPLSAGQADDILQSSGVLRDAAFTFNNHAQAVKWAQSKGDLQMLQLINDPKAFNQMRDAAKQLLNLRSGGAEKTGAEAVEQLMQAKTQLSQITNTFRTRATQGQTALYQIGNKMAELNGKIEGKFLEKLPSDEARSAFRAMNNAYSEAKGVSDALLEAASDQAKARQLVQAFRGESSASVLNRTALSRMRDHFSNVGGARGQSLANQMSSYIDSLDVSKAAIDFTRPAKISMTPSGLTGAAIATGVTGGWGAVPAAIGIAASQSPSAGLTAARSAMKVNNFIRNIPAPMLPKFLQDPTNIATMGRLIMQAPEVQAQTRDALLNGQGQQ